MISYYKKWREVKLNISQPEYSLQYVPFPRGATDG